MLDCAQAAALLQGWDKILVMSHASPDGDTLGSASALLRGLASLGKEVAFFCADPVPEKFAFLFEGLTLGTFEPEHVMAVDVADKKLLGKNAPSEYLARAELAIDHHGTHVPFARERWVEPEAAATTEMIWALLGQLGVELAPAVADCLYTGLVTDTGCFRYQNVTPRTLRIAADLLERGARAAEINRAMFESKSKAQVEAERRAMDSMRFSSGGKVQGVQPFHARGFQQALLIPAGEHRAVARGAAGKGEHRGLQGSALFPWGAGGVDHRHVAPVQAVESPQCQGAGGGFPHLLQGADNFHGVFSPSQKALTKRSSPVSQSARLSPKTVPWGDRTRHRPSGGRFRSRARSKPPPF